MEYRPIPQVTIDGKQIHFHTPAEDKSFRLFGNVGDPIIAYPPRIGKDGKLPLPSGERVRVPYFGGKITKVSPCAETRTVSYEFEVYIDLEDGTMVKHIDRYHQGMPNLWKIASSEKLEVYSLSDYRAYEKYEEERNAAFKDFEKLWAAKNPLRKECEIE